MAGEVCLALVGCGRLAERGHLPAAASARGIRLVALADRDEDRCRRVAPRVPVYRGAAELLAAEAVDAVVLATPAEAHVDDARLAAEAGVATLVEKPPAADVAGARELAALERPPWIGFNRRFDAGLAGLGARAAGGDVAELRLELRYRRRSWAPYVVRDDALTDLGGHLVDLARFLTRREVRRVRTLRLDAARARVELDLDGIRATLAMSNDEGHREACVLLNARGRTVASHVGSGAAATVRRLRRPAAPNAFVASLTRELEAFARAARGDTGTGLATAADGVAAMAALEAARCSGRDGSWYEVEAPMRPATT